MTTIKATCPACGEISLTPPDIELYVDPDGKEASSYAFRCPQCADVVRKPADDRVVRLLISGGVDPRKPASSSPQPALGDRSTGPALTPDDLIDFHTLLDRDDWFDQLLAFSPDR
jgi:predicted RNA-binding Zn-ribbon protein involved in translation (DUF1610 family)